MRRNENIKSIQQNFTNNFRRDRQRKQQKLANSVRKDAQSKRNQSSNKISLVTD